MASFQEYKKGDLYKIRFLDHCTGQQAALTCEVCGWVLKSTPSILVVTYWQVLTADNDIRDNNLEPVTILKSTIISTRKLL